MTFLRAFYFIIVTITTVGCESSALLWWVCVIFTPARARNVYSYGDFAPVTIPGQFFVMALILTTMVVVPMQAQQLAYILTNVSKYARTSYSPRVDKKHVLVVGAVDANVLGVRESARA